MRLSEEEWKQKLTPEQYRILREKGTEVPFTGELLDEKRNGMFNCAACGSPLFDSRHKFESGSGWPSFYDAVKSDGIKLEDDFSHDMHRIEAVCANCGSHLGHVFDDKDSKTGKYYCINSACLNFSPKEQDSVGKKKNYIIELMRNKKYIFIFLAIIILLGSGFLIWKAKSNLQDPSINSSTQPTVKSAPKKHSDKIRIIGTGDMLPHETVNQQAKAADSYDYLQFFDQVKQFYQAADVRFCNQESPTAPGIGVTAYPTFNAPPKFARDLSTVGCNVISLANNHLNDKGQAGIDGTRGLWEEIKPLAVAGANRDLDEQKKVAYFEIKKVKFAFVAYSEISNNRISSSYALNMLNENLVRTQLQEARSKADIVLVSVHWGTEYSPSINANQDKWAKIFAANGADIVFGTGPHVLQPVKKLPRPDRKETVIFYSLGNMLSSQLETESLIGGFAILDIDPSSKKIDQVAFLPTYMHYEWTDQQKKNEDLLARKNLKIYPLDQSSGPLSKSQNNTSVQIQTKRVTDLLNKFTEVNILRSNEY